MTDENLSEAAREARDEYIARMEEDTWRRFPTRFAGAIATDPDVTAWCDAYIQACHQHTPPPNTWSLVLNGPFGTGKTWQAYGAIRRLATAGIRITWQAASFPDMLAALRPRDGVDAEAEYERYATAGLLMVDDLCGEKPSDWSEVTLYRLVNHRSMYLLPTIWTTNLPKQPKDDKPSPLPTLRSELTGRVFSRLAESKFVAIKGEDRRQPPKATP